MPTVSLTRNSDGTWTARVEDVVYHGTHEECLGWLYANGQPNLVIPGDDYIGLDGHAGRKAGAKKVCRKAK